MLTDRKTHRYTSYVPQGTMAKKVNYNIGIYITCNELTQISSTNGEAIYDRPEVFKAKPIKVKASCKIQGEVHESKGGDFYMLLIISIYFLFVILFYF